MWGLAAPSQNTWCGLKKDSANIDDVNQLMKYVDWVKDEYSLVTIR